MLVADAFDVVTQLIRGRRLGRAVSGRYRDSLLAALFERAAQDRKHCPILVATCFDLCANQRLQPEDADREFTERSMLLSAIRS